MRKNYLAAQVALERERQIDTSVAIDLARRAADSSPFIDPMDQVYTQLYEIYAEEKKPLMLIAPFWDESSTNAQTDAGGLAGMRTAIRRGWNNAPWRDNFKLLDGYFKRPLRQEDRDIRLIFSLLKELPIILVHGYLDGDKAYPNISTWNVIPGEPLRTIITMEGRGVPPGESGKLTEITVRDEVGQSISQVAGILGEAWHLYARGREPRVDLFTDNNPFGNDRLEDWIDRVRKISVDLPEASETPGHVKSEQNEPATIEINQKLDKETVELSPERLTVTTKNEASVKEIAEIAFRKIYGDNPEEIIVIIPDQEKNEMAQTVARARLMNSRLYKDAQTTPPENFEQFYPRGENDREYISFLRAILIGGQRLEFDDETMAKIVRLGSLALCNHWHYDGKDLPFRKKACQLGDPESAYHLGTINYSIPEYVNLSLEYLTLASSRGIVASSINHVGYMFEHGILLHSDLRLAERWYVEAERRGSRGPSLSRLHKRMRKAGMEPNSVTISSAFDRLLG